MDSNYPGAEKYEPEPSNGEHVDPQWKIPAAGARVYSKSQDVGTPILQPQTKEKKTTGIRHHTSMFQFCGVYCRASGFAEEGLKDADAGFRISSGLLHAGCIQVGGL